MKKRIKVGTQAFATLFERSWESLCVGLTKLWIKGFIFLFHWSSEAMLD